MNKQQRVLALEKGMKVLRAKHDVTGEWRIVKYTIDEGWARFGDSFCYATRDEAMRVIKQVCRLMPSTYIDDRSINI